MGYNSGTSVGDLAEGKWKGILLQLGFGADSLSGKHCPCPFCGGKDRFRFTNFHGRGGWICNQCRPEAGDGFELLQVWKGWDFKHAAKEVRSSLGLVDQEDDTPTEMDPKRRRDMLNELWKPAIPIFDSNHAMDYFAVRGIREPDWTADLRYNPSVMYDVGKAAPCLLAILRNQDGKPCSMHRTFLDPQKPEKLNIPNPRRIMPGGLARGAHVRLLGGDSPTVLGVAEGIETAYAASILYEIPVWSCVNTHLLAQFEPPASVEELVIFGDNDSKYGGQLAAFKLANRMAVDPKRPDLEIRVKFPPDVGQDFNDILIAGN